MKALNEYRGKSYGDVNRLLRTGKLQGSGAESRRRDQIAKLDKYVGRGVIPERITAYRGVTAKAIPGVGRTMTDRGFVSVSLNKKVAEGFSSGGMLQISIPKGTRAGWVRPRRDRKSEHELLLPRGSRFRVVSKRYDEGLGMEVTSVRLLKPRRPR